MACKLRNNIHRIHKLMKDKNLDVKYYHINSHLIDEETRIKQKERDRKLHKTETKFKSFTETALQGNQQADTLTHNPTIEIKQPTIPITLNRYQVYHNEVLIEENLYKVIHNRLRYEDSFKWKPQGKTLIALKNENTDVTRSLWPIGHYFLHDKKELITFKHKLFTGLPTRNVMKTRQKNRTDPNNDELKFRNSFCTWCGNGILENTEHIFSCKASQTTRDKTAEKMIKQINKVYSTKTFPFWFNVDDSLQDTNTNKFDLHKYDKNWGNRGMIPKHLITYLEYILTDYRDGKAKAMEICNKWTKMASKMAFDTWILRCSHLNTYVETMQTDNKAHSNKKRTREENFTQDTSLQLRKKSKTNDLKDTNKHAKEKKKRVKPTEIDNESNKKLKTTSQTPNPKRNQETTKDITDNRNDTDLNKKKKKAKTTTTITTTSLEQNSHTEVNYGGFIFKNNPNNSSKSNFQRNIINKYNNKTTEIPINKILNIKKPTTHKPQKLKQLLLFQQPNPPKQTNTPNISHSNNS